MRCGRRQRAHRAGGHLLTGLLCLVFAACRTSPVAIVPCPEGNDILSEISQEGALYRIAADGNLYKVSGDGCELIERYFTPTFEADNYIHTGDTVSIRTPEGRFPTRSTFTESFESYTHFTDLFLRGIGDTGKIWNAMTLQSPLAQTVADYVALSHCLVEGTCAFRDNRIDLVDDPAGSAKHVLKFTAVAPSAGMVTSKASIESTIGYFAKGDELWYEARYYFTDTFPYGIADFESQWFEQSPGPRIVFDNGALAIENKFGNKGTFRQTRRVPVPRDEWVTIKLHIAFDESAGVYELWQDGVLLLAATAPTLPLSIAIQTNTEVGITATDGACVLYVDDVRLSKTPF